MSKLYREIYKLKNIARKGWVIRGVKDPETKRVESDAEHVFSMCIFACEIMSKEKLDLNQEKVLKMIMYHELGEIDVGDITPFDNIPKEEKHKKELKCIKRISKLAKMPEIIDLWQEFEENHTPEAQFVKKLDRLDAVMQSKIYAEKNNKTDVFQDFFDRHEKAIGQFEKYLD